MEIRSGCPINLSVEVLGDRWSLVVLRDMMFGNFRTYRELHGNSLEGIATNILAARLRHLEAQGFISAAADPSHKQRTIYSLTEKAIALVPVMVALGSWGVRYQPAEPTFAARSIALERGGAAMAEAFMAELRHLHLGAPAPARSVLAELNAAYETAVAERG
ncbi:MAG: helix-turn-helix transcriptional regulator [Devosia sp.]|uniref:winged helix-turn-helix transcriptional regulator n=1 Tax=Devosia sp. 66-22 TaxID=1895753 RepID=UPI00092999DB|nr:helix-turn-helix domain-containing protein [Devosia sp. 66-22]MBN9344617.1 helix-turn-helix transcriptional regulator [Devosia sp.]OJX53835.1 MAG: transcriptional regulator [Devosia sp. 66-22]